MSKKLKVELQDENGNIYYLHTAADVVFLDDGTTVEAALEKKVTASGGDISNTKLATLAASSASFPVPAAGDTPKTLWGKVKKWQQDCLAKFANYVLTSAITNQYLNDTSKIPTAALMYLLKQEVNGLNSDLINGSGLGLNEGMYSIYAPNTADDMVYPGLYRLNGITVGSMPDFYGYAIVMSSLDHTIIKQLIYHNDSTQSLLRYKYYNKPWTDAGEFALKNDTLRYESNNSDIKIFSATSVNGGFLEVDVNTTNEKYQLLFQTTQKKILARYFDGEQWNDQVVASWS